MSKGGHLGRRARSLSFFIICLTLCLSLLSSLYHLRQNNLEMNRLREAVFEADRLGKSDAEVERALQLLRKHVINHMNSDLGGQEAESQAHPIQLPYKYYRDTLKVWYGHIKRIETNDKQNINLSEALNEARVACGASDLLISERLQCLVEQTASVTGMPDPPQLPVEFYVFTFDSPSWSPDAAGWSLMVFFLSIPALILRFLF